MIDLTTSVRRARRRSSLLALGCALLAPATTSHAQCLGTPAAQPLAAPPAASVRFGGSCLAPNLLAADIFDDIGDGLVDVGARVGAEVAGGFTGAVGFAGGTYVDELEDEAIGLPPAFADIIRAFMALEDFPGAFTEEDLQRARILPTSHPGAEQFVTEGHSGVTLDTLIIVKDARYDRILAWDRSWVQVLGGELSSAQRKALFLVLHELVHVRQFREMGRQAFLDEYLPSVVHDGDHGARLEEEAYRMAPRKGSWAREVLDAYAGPM
jgi:hypothetical protein